MRSNLPSSGPVPAGFAVLHGPLKSNVMRSSRFEVNSSPPSNRAPLFADRHDEQGLRFVRERVQRSLRRHLRAPGLQFRMRGVPKRCGRLRRLAVPCSPFAAGFRLGTSCSRRGEREVEKPTHLHLAFVAENRRQVEAFYRAALKAGGKDNGAPGLRPQYHANYYAAFVIGPDGHNIEAVCHEPEA
jgi:hypothetical protein